MALYNVTTSGSDLYAIGYPAHATSEVVNQDAEDTDFESVRETRVHWNLANISTPTSTADTLVTSIDLSDGDRIFIRLNDGTLVDTIATGVQAGLSPANPNMTSNTEPEGICASSSDGINAWKAFDDSPSTYVTISHTGDWIQYSFKDNIPQTINKYYIKQMNAGKSWTIEGSIDGTNWSTIGTEVNVNSTAGVIYDIESPGSFSHYRIVAGNETHYYYTFNLLGDGVTADTSAITVGETPDQVFKLEDTISFNGAEAYEKDIYYEYGSYGSALYALVLYEDVALTGRQITTRVDFSAPGNRATEITGQVFKELA